MTVTLHARLQVHLTTPSPRTLLQTSVFLYKGQVGSIDITVLLLFPRYNDKCSTNNRSSKKKLKFKHGKFFFNYPFSTHCLCSRSNNAKICNSRDPGTAILTAQNRCKYAQYLTASLFNLHNAFLN